MAEHDDLATEVVLIITKALSPVLERLAGMEARLAVLGDLRDRVVTVETKSAIVAPAPPAAAPVDLSPMLERLAGAEARIAVLGDRRDRVVTIEAKAAAEPAVLSPAPSAAAATQVDLTPLIERLAALQARIEAAEGLETKDTSRIEGYTAFLQRDAATLSERVAALEARAPIPGPPGAPGKDAVVVETKAVAVSDGALDGLRERIVSLETRAAGPSLSDMGLVELRQRFTDLEDRVQDDSLAKDIGALRERIAAMEARPPVPGPPGTPGAPGKDGQDAVGFDDLSVVQEDDRSFTVKAARGERVKTIGTARFPVQIHRGVFSEWKSYEHGDVVTWGGSQWHANESTSKKPGDGSKAWTLTVKRGNDGKDLREGMTPSAPVVSLKGQ